MTRLKGYSTQSRISFKRMIGASFIVVLLILVIIFFVFQKSKAQGFENARSVEHTYDVLSVAEKINTGINEIQSGARGFIISGEEYYLPLFNNSTDSIGRIIDKFMVLTKDNPSQQIRIDTLRTLTDNYIASRKELISIRRNEGFEVAQKIFVGDSGRLVADKMRSVLLSMKQEEDQLLAERKARYDEGLRRSSQMTFILFVSIGLLLSFAFLLIYYNTRARDKAEAALKASEEKYSTLFNSIDQGFCIIEMIFDKQNKPVDYRFLVINNSFEKQTGLVNAVGKRMREFVPDHEEHWFEIYGKIALTGEPMRFENRAEQLQRWYDVYAFPIGEPKDMHVAILFNDISERRKAEAQVRELNTNLEKRVEEKTKEVVEKETQYRFLIENMREGIQVLGFDWRYVFVNKAVVNQSKYSKEELLQRTIMESYPGVEETELFRMLKICMEERIPQLMESEFVFPDGTKEWFELSIQPVPEGIFILSMDITARKNAEIGLVRFAQELKRSNTELERFAYIASHDLQEPLRMVSSFLNLLEDELEEKLDDATRSYINFAVDGATRMKTLINDLLQYSRVGTNKEEFTAIDVNETMSYVLRILDEEIKKTKAIVKISPLPVIRANKMLVGQVFINLISNALKYRGDKQPEIEIGSAEEGGSYVFYVKDNGIGINPKFYEKIFVIFQRLHGKTEHSGTGIGLAICKKIVESHNGKIWVESEEGKGSVFYFSIPKNEM
jgi:PAS domain S-box-containing protein